MSPRGRRGSGSRNNGDYRFDGSTTSAGAGAGAGVAAGGGHSRFDGEGISPIGGRRLSTVVAPHDAALAAVLSAAKPLAADGTEAG